VLAICTGCDSQPPANPGSNAPQPVATWANPPKGLEFLSTVPELQGISMDISEAEFLKLVEPQDLTIKTDRSSENETSYYITTPSGENVVVMFTDGACSGIQRLQPTPVADTR
jgi:hypothetical protein